MPCGCETSHAHACMAGRLELKRLHLVQNAMSAVLTVQVANHMSKALAQFIASPAAAVHICVLHSYCSICITFVYYICTVLQYIRICTVYYILDCLTQFSLKNLQVVQNRWRTSVCAQC